MHVEGGLQAMIGKEQLFYDNDRLCIEIARGEGIMTFKTFRSQFSIYRIR